jgi:hypothetical protein
VTAPSANFDVVIEPSGILDGNAFCWGWVDIKLSRLDLEVNIPGIAFSGLSCSFLIDIS